MNPTTFEVFYEEALFPGGQKHSRVSTGKGITLLFPTYRSGSQLLLETGDNEILISNPTSTSILSAVKLTGRPTQFREITV
jgi:hypothetical protein